MSENARNEMDEIAELLGGEVLEVEVNPDEIDVALVLRDIRQLLLSAAGEEGVGVNELARRLDVSPAAVSRMCRSEGDMRVSTMVLWAKALQRHWDISLSRRLAKAGSNSPSSHRRADPSKVAATEGVSYVLRYNAEDHTLLPSAPAT